MQEEARRGNSLETQQGDGRKKKKLKASNSIFLSDVGS